MTALEMFPSEPDKAVLFRPDRNDPASTQLFDEVFAGSGVATWADERVGRYAEFVTPRMVYLAGPDNHRVAWVSHQGLTSLYRGDTEPAYAEHHVVCDCAVEIGEPEPHPNSVIECDFVQDVLTQRARDLAQEQSLDDALQLLVEFDSETFNYRLTPEGQAVAIQALILLLENDKRRPEEWMANKISGEHHVDLLAAFLKLDITQVMTLLEMMQDRDIINLSKDKVKLTRTQPSLSYFD